MFCCTTYVLLLLPLIMMMMIMCTVGVTVTAYLHCSHITQRDDASEAQRKVLEIMRRTFATYTTDDPRAAELKRQLNEAEAELAAARNTMALGYTEPESGAWWWHVGAVLATNAWRYNGALCIVVLLHTTAGSKQRQAAAAAYGARTCPRRHF